MSCDCNKVDTEGCAPMPAVDRGVRAIVRGADGCPAELTGTGVLAQGPGGAYIGDGTVNKPICVPDLVSSASPNALMGLTAPNGCYRKFTGNGSEDTGKVVKWDGSSFVLRSLLESLCYPASVVQDTCCPTAGLAVWQQTGSSLCLQQWNPCDDITHKAISNPKFVGCENETMVTFAFCDFPELIVGTEYRQVVCTDDGPRVLGAATGDIKTRQFIPFDLIGSGDPLLISSTTIDDGDGNNHTLNIDLASESGTAIPSGSTHVMIIVNMALTQNNDLNTLAYTLYSPAAVSSANQRGYLPGLFGDEGTTALSVTFNVPISEGRVSLLFTKSGSTNDWSMNVRVRLEGYWVG